MNGSVLQRFCMPHVARITEKSEYQRVFSRGEKLWGRLFVCYVLVEATTECRMGPVVSRKVGGAVIRNRVKRHVREFFRMNRHRLTPGLQLVVVARAACAAQSGHVCARELERMLGRHLTHDK
ncbi:MAG: ribonuclease P protein component [Candidatus Hydrogenedentes bacterium]|nr:ribonuclease P protein component [Candidatus Hydrogenedentota bacterium]